MYLYLLTYYFNSVLLMTSSKHRFCYNILFFHFTKLCVHMYNGMQAVLLRMHATFGHE